MIITNSIGDIKFGGCFDYPNNPILLNNTDNIYSDSFILGISDSLYNNQIDKSELMINNEDIFKLPKIIYLIDFPIYRDNLLSISNNDLLVSSINNYRSKFGVKYNIDFGELRIIYNREEYSYIYSPEILNKVKNEYLKWVLTFKDTFKLTLKYNKND